MRVTGACARSPTGPRTEFCTANDENLQRGSPSGVMTQPDLPIIFSLEWPYIFSAAGFQLVMMPSGPMPMMASSLSSATAAVGWALLTTCFCLVRSCTAAMTKRPSSVSIWDKLRFKGNSLPSRCRPRRHRGVTAGFFSIVSSRSGRGRRVPGPAK